MNWLTLITQTVVALLGAAGLREIVVAVARRKVTKVDAADKLTESAIELINTANSNALDARKEAQAVRIEFSDARREVSRLSTEAAEARREASDARRMMAQATQDAERVVRYLQSVVTLIHTPTMTLERLRALVPDAGENGQVRLPLDRP